MWFQFEPENLSLRLQSFESIYTSVGLDRDETLKMANVRFSIQYDSIRRAVT